MYFGEIVFIFVIALLLTLILVGGLNWRRHEEQAAWPAVFFVFLILFPILWVADLWLRPAGPVVLDVYWVPLIIVGLIVVLIIAALVPPRRRRMVTRGEASEAEAAAYAALGIFFWVLLIVLIVSIIVGYASQY